MRRGPAGLRLFENQLSISDAQVVEAAFDAKLMLPQLWREAELVSALNRTSARAIVTSNKIDGVLHSDLAGCLMKPAPHARPKNNGLLESVGEPVRDAAAERVVVLLKHSVTRSATSQLVTTQPFLICGRTPSDAHHIKFAEPRAMGREVSDKFTVPVLATPSPRTAPAWQGKLLAAPLRDKAAWRRCRALEENT
jgi:hypothetical protein